MFVVDVAGAASNRILSKMILVVEEERSLCWARSSGMRHSNCELCVVYHIMVADVRSSLVIVKSVYVLKLVSAAR